MVVFHSYIYVKLPEGRIPKVLKLELKVGINRQKQQHPVGLATNQAIECRRVLSRVIAVRKNDISCGQDWPSELRKLQV